MGELCTALTTFDDNSSHVLHTADIMVFDIHHIEIVVDDDADLVKTIGYNTGSNVRDGEGCIEQWRKRKEAQMFIRLLP